MLEIFLSMFPLQATDGRESEKDAGAPCPNPGTAQACRHAQETQRECRFNIVPHYRFEQDESLTKSATHSENAIKSI